MKYLKSTATLFLIIFILTSCSILQQPISVDKPGNNPTYEVEYLFEHEGLKFYRFRDSGNYVYFTKGSGEITSIRQDSTSNRVTSLLRSGISK